MSIRRGYGLNSAVGIFGTGISTEGEEATVPKTHDLGYRRRSILNARAVQSRP
jgi:hypothetical protein